MTALYIIGGILLFLLLLLIIPISAEAGFTDIFAARVKYGGIKVFDTSKPKKQKKLKTKKPKSQKPKADKPKEKKESFITRIFKEKGKIGGIKFCFAVLKAGLLRVIWLIKKITVKKLFLDITVSSDDAAGTAIAYGGVCAAVYPVVAIVKENTKVGISEVNISTDFDKLSPVIKAQIAVKTRLIYALIAAISFVFAYFKIKKESEKNERK